MQPLISKAAPAQQAPAANPMQEQIDLATAVIKDTIYEEDAAEQLLSVIQNTDSVGKGLGKAIMIAIVPIAEDIKKQEPNIDDSIWLSEGGVLDNVINELIEIAQAAGLEVSDEDIQMARDTVMEDVGRLAEEEQAQTGAM